MAPHYFSSSNSPPSGGAISHLIQDYNGLIAGQKTQSDSSTTYATTSADMISTKIGAQFSKLSELVMEWIRSTCNGKEGYFVTRFREVGQQRDESDRLGSADIGLSNRSLEHLCASGHCHHIVLSLVIWTFLKNNIFLRNYPIGLSESLLGFIGVGEKAVSQRHGRITKLRINTG